jgi:DNA-binding response OmpR family regulator
MRNLKRKILYVEDDVDLCRTFVAFLRDYEVIAAHTYAEGIAQALGSKFDMYIIDRGLPDGSGIDLCKQIRIFDTTTPVIFCSGGTITNEIKEAYEAGAEAYFVKPVSLIEVERAIEQLIPY